MMPESSGLANGWDPREDGWFAGFADGEAHFALELNNRQHRQGATVIPVFKIMLRADDIGVLRTLAEAFGGSLYFRPGSRSGEHVSKPLCAWKVAPKRNLAQLVRYFDEFPLHAKKSRDYALWREAVLIYCAHGGRDPRLRPLRDALMEGRRYDAPEMDEPDLADPYAVQLALGID